MSSVLALALLLSMAACSGGNNTTAASMHLRRTQGTVSVSDGNGKDLPVLDNLSLYSGYGVNTRSASYAWIDLDEVKLAKLDQNSEIAIQQEGKVLDIELKSGSLFFNVTEPLEDDETMNIRTSTMLIGIRGTSGWVEANSGLSRAYILEGKVECSAGGQTVLVNAGEFAELTADGELVIKPFTDEDIPAFVRDEPDADLPGGADETPAPDGAEAPDPTEAPAPTETPAASDTPTPTPTDTPTPTPTSTPMPAPTPTPTPTPTSDPDFTIINGVLVEYNGPGGAVTIPSSVTSIGDYAFEYCSSLTGVTIPDGVISIGEGTFFGCASLTNVIIPDSVTSIGDWAFIYCGLTSVTIPDSVTSIGEGAFMGCDSLTDVHYSGSAAQWGQIGMGDYNDELLNAAIHYNS